MSPDEDHAERLYRAYAEALGWRTMDGATLPPWDALTNQERQAWCAAAQAIVDAWIAEIKMDVRNEILDAIEQAVHEI